MIVKKFSYTNKFDIIAPLKCGTRWLEKNTNPNHIELIKYNELFDKNQIHKEKTFFIYRDILEHFKSGLYTEYLGFNHIPVPNCESYFVSLKLRENILFYNKYKNINQLFKKLTIYNKHSAHFIPNLWEKMYHNKPNFIFTKLHDLKNIFDDENISYDPTNFDFSKEYYDVPSKEEVFNMLSADDLTKLNRIIEKETHYLNETLSIK
jgi:hypothetical protein